MTRPIDRRHFLEQSARVAIGVGLASLGCRSATERRTCSSERP